MSSHFLFLYVGGERETEKEEKGEGRGEGKGGGESGREGKRRASKFSGDSSYKDRKILGPHHFTLITSL